MPSNIEIGVTEASDLYVQSVDIEKKVSEVVRQDKDGKFLVGKTFDPVISGSLKLVGKAEDEVGDDAGLTTALSSISGGVTIVTEKTHTTTQDNFDETDVSFENYPGAS